MLFLFPLLFALSAFALKQKELTISNYQLCPTNVNATYFIVGVGCAKSAQSPTPVGMPFVVAESACEFFGMRLANLTQPQLADIYSLGVTCGGSAGLWFGVYESLAPPFGCYSLFGASLVTSNSTICATSILKAVCEVPNDIVQPYPTITYTTLQTTSTSTSFIVSVDTETTSLTDFEFIHTTSTVTEGTFTVTYTTSTTTAVNTVHRHHHHHSSSSSSNNLWNKKDVRNAKKADTFVQCNTTLNNFFLVQNQSLGNNATIQNACDSIGYPIANVTGPILSNIAGMFTGCSSPVAGADSWYGYTPLGCLLVGNNGVSFIEDPSGAAYQQYCLNQPWALCRAGPPVITTSTVQTDDFTTLSPFFTLTVTSTSVHTASTSVSTTITTTSPTTISTIFFTNASLTTVTTTDSTSVIIRTKTICSTTTVCGKSN